MKTLTATYRVTTPLFCGGADPKAVGAKAELRPASFKGMLRWWWRALRWEPGLTVEQLWQEEAALFGSSDREFGQSKVLLRVRAETEPKSTQDRLWTNRASTLHGVAYLGYGLIVPFGERAGALNRPMLEPLFLSKVELASRDEATLRKLIRPLKALGLMGGLGSRSRRGFGSLSLVTLAGGERGGEWFGEPWEAPRTADMLANEVEKVLGNARLRAAGAEAPPYAHLPEWSAFSGGSRVVVVGASDGLASPLRMLDRMGREMVRFRSWGHDGQILGGGEQAERNFEDDHELRRHHHVPNRVAYGLPHNYHFSGRGGGSVMVCPAAKGLDRRGSPLWLHVHQPDADVAPLGVATFLPSRFLPAHEDKVAVGGDDRRLDTERLWKPIDVFLDRLCGAKPPRDASDRLKRALDRKEPLTATEVTP